MKEIRVCGICNDYIDKNLVIADGFDYHKSCIDKMSLEKLCEFFDIDRNDIIEFAGDRVTTIDDLDEIDEGDHWADFAYEEYREEMVYGR